VPLVHTDVALDVRGLAAAATVTQQYVNSGTELSRRYVFSTSRQCGLRHGNPRWQSADPKRDREREEANASTIRQVRRQARRLVEEERPNIFTASVANLMPGDHIDVRLRYVEPCAGDGRIHLVFPMVVGPRYIPARKPSVTPAPAGLSTPTRV